MPFFRRQNGRCCVVRRSWFHLAMLALLWFFFSRVGADARAVWRSLRALYPVFFIWAAYSQTGLMNHLVSPGFHDDWLRQLDQYH